MNQELDLWTPHGFLRSGGVTTDLSSDPALECYTVNDDFGVLEIETQAGSKGLENRVGTLGWKVTTFVHTGSPVCTLREMCSVVYKGQHAIMVIKNRGLGQCHCTLNVELVRPPIP